MKKITYILACACMMGLTSCADTFLDLEPLDSRTDAVYFKNRNISVSLQMDFTDSCLAGARV